MRTLLCTLLLSIACSFSVKAQEADDFLNAFENLCGGTWYVEANWSSGDAFKQETQYEKSLDGKIIKIKTFGTINIETGERGLRNEGICAFDKASKSYKFWSFDVFGDYTQGDLIIEGKDIYYRYTYNGQQLTEVWQFKNENTYHYIIGTMENNEWKQKYLDTEYIRK